MFYNHVFTGVAVIVLGILLIIISWLLDSFGMPDIFLGYYTGPLAVLLGGGILVWGRDKED